MPQTKQTQDSPLRVIFYDKKKNTIGPAGWLLMTILVVGIFFLLGYILQISLDFVIPNIKASIEPEYDPETYKPMSYWSGVLILVISGIIGLGFRNNDNRLY